MGVENLQADGATILSNADNVQADGANISEVQADSVVYWQRDTGGAGTDVLLPSSLFVSSVTQAPDDALARINFNPDGTITRDYNTTSGSVTGEFLANWVTDPNDVGFDPANYQIQATVNNGTPPAGDNLNQFLSLSVIRSWELQELIAGSDDSCQLSVEVNEIADPTGNTDTVNVNLFVNKGN